jgi:hypothetical protein
MNFNYLHTPVVTIVDPPIVSNVQSLPLEKLSWEDFEKLCLAIVQIKFSINDCEIYGTKGQAQEGIDIFAKQENGRYSTYQCKRYKEFEPDDLAKIVDFFKSKKFFKQTDKLVVSTSCEWNKTQFQDKFEELKTELENDKIELVKWDKIQLCRILKKHPDIVFDFFGGEWVKRFNGEHSLIQISKKKKLDATQVASFRKELYEFYSTIFNIQDPGIPIQELEDPYTIQERFIIPDIISNVQSENFGNSQENSSSNGDPLYTDEDQFYYDESWSKSSEYLQINNKKKLQEVIEETSLGQRLDIDEALCDDNKYIIIGDPGAGKSTLLRFLVLDVLSLNPTLENISYQYGKLLPVWLPFAFITKHLAQDDRLSISELLSLWFKSFGKEYLFEIVKDALYDERLFLIIDGIDEWNNVSSAQQAIARIETVIDLFDCHVLYSSRPYGFKLLKDFFRNLKILTLANFSKTQQKDFIEKWYSRWTSSPQKVIDREFSKRQAEIFVKELAQTGDLKKLAENPLLLSILIVQKMRDYVLPKNKLDALKEITQYLISKHPLKRIKDAGIVQVSSNEIDFKEIFCELAIYIQKESNDGVISKLEAQKAVENYLIKYAGYDKAKAKFRSQEFIDVGANNFGIIIEKSSDEVSFSHKQFQEFLAAQYLFESDQDLSKEFLQTHSANPAFHQVVTNFFGLIPPKQIKLYEIYFRCLNNAKYEMYQENYLKLLSYEVSINLDNTPNDIVNRSLESIIHHFEYESDPLFKEALLKRILDALSNGKIKDQVQDFLLQYIPNQNKFRDNRVRALSNAKYLSCQQIEFLQKAMINGSIQIKLDASNAIKCHIKNPEVFRVIKKIISECANPEIVSFAINSIITSDLEYEIVDQLIGSIKIEGPLVEFFLEKYKVFSKQQNDEDIENVLRIAGTLHYCLSNEISELLINGYGRSEKLKNVLLESTKRHVSDNGIRVDPEIAWKVLFFSFTFDNDVIQRIENEIGTEEYPFGTLNGEETWGYLIRFHKENQPLKIIVEEWFNKNIDNNTGVDIELFIASAFIRSDKAKKYLLERMSDSGSLQWNVRSLLDGWDNDEYVKNELKGYFINVDPQITRRAANFVSRIFRDDKETGIQVLENILFKGDNVFDSKTISAFIELDPYYFENNILEKLVETFDSFPKEIINHYYAAIKVTTRQFYSNSFVKSYILKHVEDDSHIYGLYVQYYQEQSDFEHKQLRSSLPLLKRLRSLIVERCCELESLDDKMLNGLSEFNKEEDSEVKGDMALCLFTHLKRKSSDRILEICNPLIFSYGFSTAIQRNIAFSGFLITHKLAEYFLIEDVNEEQVRKARPFNIFREYRNSNYVSGLIIQTLISEFDYLVSVVGKNFQPIMETSRMTVEGIWGFFARHSVKSSPSFPYIMEFISENSSTINNQDLIGLLGRVSPKSTILKNMLLRILLEPGYKDRALAGRMLGNNFKDDPQVYDAVKNISDYKEYGKIVALCTGWQNELILKKIWNQVNSDNLPIDYYAGYHLKFLFSSVEDLLFFLKLSLNQLDKIESSHKYFFVPMLERLKSDKAFANAIKARLFEAKSISEKISYYNLLTQVNLIDAEVKAWKAQVNSKNDYGYDIISNRIVRLKDILHDYYF